MKKNLLKNQRHTRKDEFVYHINEEDFPSVVVTSSSGLRPRRTTTKKQYMITIIFNNGEFSSVKHSFPANKDQRTIYRVYAEIDREIDRIAELMHQDASIQEIIKIQEIEEKNSHGKKLVQIMKNGAKKTEAWDVTGPTSREVETVCIHCDDPDCDDEYCGDDDGSDDDEVPF